MEDPPPPPPPPFADGDESKKVRPCGNILALVPRFTEGLERAQVTDETLAKALQAGSSTPLLLELLQQNDVQMDAGAGDAPAVCRTPAACCEKVACIVGKGPDSSSSLYALTPPSYTTPAVAFPELKDITSVSINQCGSKVLLVTLHGTDVIVSELKDDGTRLVPEVQLRFSEIETLEEIVSGPKSLPGIFLTLGEKIHLFRHAVLQQKAQRHPEWLLPGGGLAKISLQVSDQLLSAASKSVTSPSFDGQPKIVATFAPAGHEIAAARGGDFQGNLFIHTVNDRDPFELPQVDYRQRCDLHTKDKVMSIEYASNNALVAFTIKKIFILYRDSHPPKIFSVSQEIDLPYSCSGALLKRGIADHTSLALALGAEGDGLPVLLWTPLNPFSHQAIVTEMRFAPLPQRVEHIATLWPEDCPPEVSEWSALVRTKSSEDAPTVSRTLVWRDNREEASTFGGFCLQKWWDFVQAELQAAKAGLKPESIKSITEKARASSTVAPMLAGRMQQLTGEVASFAEYCRAPPRSLLRRPEGFMDDLTFAPQPGATGVQRWSLEQIVLTEVQQWFTAVVEQTVNSMCDGRDGLTFGEQLTWAQTVQERQPPGLTQEFANAKQAIERAICSAGPVLMDRAMHHEVPLAVADAKTLLNAAVDNSIKSNYKEFSHGPVQQAIQRLQMATHDLASQATSNQHLLERMIRDTLLKQVAPPPPPLSGRQASATAGRGSNIMSIVANAKRRTKRLEDELKSLEDQVGGLKKKLSQTGTYPQHSGASGVERLRTTPLRTSPLEHSFLGADPGRR